MRISSFYPLLVMVLAAAKPALSQTAPGALPGPPTPPLRAAEPLWRTQGKGGLNLNEATLSSNWRGGGANTIGLSVLANAKANRKQGVHSFDNEAEFLFAFSQTAGLGYRKTQDRLCLDTKYGRAIGKKWDTFVSLNLLSQFAPGYRYDPAASGGPPPRQVSGLFAPAYLTAAYGFEYHPNEAFGVPGALCPAPDGGGRVERFVGPLGDAPYGVNPGHGTRWELLATQVLANYDKNRNANLHLKARYLLFANYHTWPSTASTSAWT